MPPRYAELSALTSIVRSADRSVDWHVAPSVVASRSGAVRPPGASLVDDLDDETPLRCVRPRLERARDVEESDPQRVGKVGLPHVARVREVPQQPLARAATLGGDLRDPVGLGEEPPERDVGLVVQGMQLVHFDGVPRLALLPFVLGTAVSDVAVHGARRIASQRQEALPDLAPGVGVPKSKSHR